ncbi:unnamed protein product, partial [Ectocarpus sp. 12 AP-2014]
RRQHHRRGVPRGRRLPGPLAAAAPLPASQSIETLRLAGVAVPLPLGYLGERGVEAVRVVLVVAVLAEQGELGVLLAVALPARTERAHHDLVVVLAEGASGSVS